MDFDYESLPIFYEVVQSKNKHLRIINYSHDIKIYMMYDIQNEFNLRNAMIEFVRQYLSKQSPVPFLYSINVLPSSVLNRIIRVVGNSMNLNLIKIYFIRSLSGRLQMKVYRATEYDSQYTSVMNMVDKIVNGAKISKINNEKSIRMYNTHHNRYGYTDIPQFYPFCYNILNLELANGIFATLQLKYLDTNINRYIRNTSIVYNNYEN